MKRGLIPAAILIATAVMTTAAGEREPANANHLLKGRFSFIATEHCVYAADFGKPPVVQAVGPTTFQTNTLQGIIQFNGDGVGTITGQSASQLMSTFAVPAQLSDLNCSVKYHLTIDSAFRMERKCQLTMRRGSGSEMALLSAVSPVTISGYLHGDTLMAANIEQNVESLTLSSVTSPRLCQRTLTAYRIKKLG